MRPGGSPLLPELARLAELIQDSLVVAAAAAALVAAMIGVHQLWCGRALRRHRGALRWRVHHRVVRSFAAAVAGADLDRADALAGRTLGRHPGHRERRWHQPRTVSWDETVVMNGPRLEAAAQLRRRECVAAWCRGLRRVPGPSGDVLVMGRFHPLQAKLLSRQWLGHGGLRVSADIGGVVVVAQVMVRPGPAARHDQAQGDRTEVWVHVEGPAGWRARRLLRRLRRTTKRSLCRWADERARPSPSDHRVPWFTRRPGPR